MKVDVKDLLSIIEKIKPGTTKSQYIEAMSYLFFSGTDVITYNDQISIQHKFKTDFSLFVKATDLQKLLSKLKTGDIEMDEKDDKLSISCKTTKANLPTILDEEVSTRINSVTGSLKKAKWNKLSDDFISSILLCSYTASKQDSDGTLTCVHVTGENCIASDNNRVAHAILESEMPEMFIKASEIKNLSKIKPTSYYISKSWLHFKNESGCIFSIRKLIGNYPDFLALFDFEGTKIPLPKNILDGLDIATIFADSLDPAMNFKISKGFIILSVKSTSGTVRHRAKIGYVGKDIQFTINPSFLKEMMSYSSSIVLSKEKAKLETETNFRMVTVLYS